MSTIRVAVVDDQPLIRTGLRTLLEHAADVEIVGEAGDGDSAVALVRRYRPDVVLMDIRMRVLDGIEATRRITADASLPGVRVVVLTTFDLDEYVYAALRAGASGFLLKDEPPEDILAAIRVVAAGDALLAPRVTRRLIAQGLSNEEIAGLLVIAESTAKTHVKRILAKIGARDRAQAVVLAYRSGLMTPGDR